MSQSDQHFEEDHHHHVHAEDHEQCAHMLHRDATPHAHHHSHHHDHHEGDHDKKGCVHTLHQDADPHRHGCHRSRFEHKKDWKYDPDAAISAKFWAEHEYDWENEVNSNLDKVYDKGHSVVGVDISKGAPEAFFNYHKIEFTVTPMKGDKGQIYQSKDGRLKFYLCDLYSFNSEFEGKFDAVFDKGSLDSINKVDRFKYAQLMVEIMKPDCKYMLVSLEFDTQLHIGPPQSIPEFVIHDMYEKTCNIEQVSYRDVLCHERNWTKLKSMYEKVHIITPK